MYVISLFSSHSLFCVSSVLLCCVHPHSSIALLVVACCTLIALAVIFVVLPKHKCLPPPYLYVTFHGGTGKHDVNNIKRYSRNGCDLGYVLDETDAEGLNENLSFLSSYRSLLTTSQTRLERVERNGTDTRIQYSSSIPSSSYYELTNPFALLL